MSRQMEHSNFPRNRQTPFEAEQALLEREEQYRSQQADRGNDTDRSDPSLCRQQPQRK